MRRKPHSKRRRSLRPNPNALDVSLVALRWLSLKHFDKHHVPPNVSRSEKKGEKIPCTLDSYMLFLHLLCLHLVFSRVSGLSIMEQASQMFIHAVDFQPPERICYGFHLWQTPPNSDDSLLQITPHQARGVVVQAKASKNFLCRGKDRRPSSRL